MPTLRSHTHLQATQANAQTNACKEYACPSAQGLSKLDTTDR
jgi:hypothetical protein